MKTKSVWLGILATFVLSGCSVTGLENASNTFACGYDGDPRCEALSDVHEEVIGAQGNDAKKEVFITADGEPITRVAYEKPLATPKRAPEMILRIWVAPFIDEDGDLHDEHVLYSTVYKARWAPETLAVHKSAEPRVLRPLQKKPETRAANETSVIRRYIEGAMSK